MTAVNKIDSNSTGLSYSEEVSPKTLAGAPVWMNMEPNSYKDFGGTLAVKARNPINAGRQRRKGVTVDLDAVGGFQTDLTQSNLQDLLQGFFFASLRKKGEAKNALGVATMTIAVTAATDRFTVGGTGGPADLTAVFQAGDLVYTTGFVNAANNGLFKVVTTAAAYITVCAADGANTAVTTVDETANSAASIVRVGFETAVGDLDVDASLDLPALTSTLLDFATLDLSVGEWLYLGGDVAATQFTTAANNGFARVRTIAANRLTLDKAQATMVTEANTTKLVQIFIGRCLKNEVGADIVRRTYQLERTLGMPDTTDTEPQSEVVTGAVPNEITFNIPSADKITVDLTFVGMDHEVRTADEGTKSGDGTVVVVAGEDAFNTSSDLTRIKLAVHSDTNEALTPLFAFANELTLVINNNVSPDKAVGVLGAFDATAGQFQVSGSITAYFCDVAALAAIRNNSNITLDMHMVKNNTGISIDVPLITLGDGKCTIERDQAIKLPLSSDAASGVDVDTDMDHTLLMVFFDYLPTAAE
jgi:hypothetical protein